MGVNSQITSKLHLVKKRKEHLKTIMFKLLIHCFTLAAVSFGYNGGWVACGEWKGSADSCQNCPILRGSCDGDCKWSNGDCIPRAYKKRQARSLMWKKKRSLMW